MKFKPGDLFLYQLDNKFGVIQLIEKSKVSGYNVRIFCTLMNENCNEEIYHILQSTRYYFIKNFDTNDLIKSNYIVPAYLDNNINMPKYMRACERKINGSIVWYIFDVEKGIIINKYNKCNNVMIKLSPYESWGIDYIKKRWAENFDLEKWNDDLLDTWYLNYLKLYEPEKVHNFNINHLKNNSILKKWRRTKRISNEILELVEKIFIEFIRGISKTGEFNNTKDDSIEKLITKLNKINSRFNFIQTIESEELLEYINYLLKIHDIIDDNDIIDSHREW